MIDRIAADVSCAGTGLPGIAVTTACPFPVAIADNVISLRVPRTNERRPDPLYPSNLVVSNDAESWYDGLQTEWAKRLSRGLSFTANYTRSRSLDTTGLYKSFRFAQEQGLHLRVEVYNLFNTVQYGFPTTDIGSGTFGQISSTHATDIPRTVQIALRYRF